MSHQEESHGVKVDPKDILPPRRERRLRIVRIPMHWLIETMFCLRTDEATGDETVTVARHDYLPNGYVVDSYWHDPAHNSLAVAISHPSFDDVPDGRIPPEVVPDGMVTWWRYMVATQDELLKRPQRVIPDDDDGD